MKVLLNWLENPLYVAPRRNTHNMVHHALENSHKLWTGSNIWHLKAEATVLIWSCNVHLGSAPGSMFLAGDNLQPPNRINLVFQKKQ